MYHFTQNRRPGLPMPLDGQYIHAIDCKCSDCTLDRRRNLRLDIGVILLGIVSALIAAGTIMLLGIK